MCSLKMYTCLLIGIISMCSFGGAAGKNAEPKQKWNYVKVRENANMFWWLYYSTHGQGYEHRPLVLWLQGGPGGSSTGFGNFLEIGPVDVNLKPRNTTWLQEASLLFVDNPVGTGYSYVTDKSAYTKDLAGIVKDLLTLFKQFLNEVPEMKKAPFFIFSESYGGKMTVGLANGLQDAIQSGAMECNFQGFAMGDSWISPVDSVMSWGPYLFATSLVDEVGLAAIQKSAKQCKAAYEAGEFANSTALWGQTESVIESVTNGVNFYNILKWGGDNRSKEKMKQEALLGKLMNGPIKAKLQIVPANVTWGAQSGAVFENQKVDFMKPVVNIVDKTLTAKLKVVVYNGQLDLIVDTAGTAAWVQELKWSGLPHYNSAERKPFGKDQMMGFVKKYNNFSFYWILKAGHMVPDDAGAAALFMLKDVISS